MSETDQASLGLRDELLSAAASDYDRLASLCSQHTATIVANFPAWAQPTADDLTDAGSAAWETRIGGLYAVAKVFANHLDNLEPLKFLLAADQSSEIAQWERRLAQSMQLIHQFRYDDAVRLLNDQLIDARKLVGHGHLHLQATTHWYLSQAHWLRRDRDPCVGHAERSLQITERINDDPKYLLRYLRHLYEMHRYFGEPSAAAKYADAVAEFLAGDDNDAAANYRSQAKILRGRGGEPLARAVVWAGNRRYEVDELPSLASVELKLGVERNRITLQSASVLAEQGKAARAAGRVDEALGLFRQAQKADPYDPDAVMLEAFALASQERFFEAAARFEEVERLAPGWPGCRTSLWFCQRIAAGELSAEAFALAATLEATNPDSPGRTELLRDGLQQFPDVALLWLEEAARLKAGGATAEARAAFERGLAARGDDDVRTRLLLEIAQVEEGTARESRLREAVALNGNLVAAAVAELMLDAPRK